MSLHRGLSGSKLLGIDMAEEYRIHRQPVMDTTNWASTEQRPRRSLRAAAERLANGALSFSGTLTYHTLFVVLNATYATVRIHLMNQTHLSSDEMQIQAVNHNSTGVLLVLQVKRVAKKIIQLMTKTTHACPCTHAHSWMQKAKQQSLIWCRKYCMLVKILARLLYDYYPRILNDGWVWDEAFRTKAANEWRREVKRLKGI